MYGQDKVTARIFGKVLRKEFGRGGELSCIIGVSGSTLGIYELCITD